MAATMKDVAERAGVSIATVSFVINNTKRVTPETRLRIETAMADLGFRRNVVARALASRRTRIIALVYPRWSTGSAARSPTSSPARPGRPVRPTTTWSSGRSATTPPS